MRRAILIGGALALLGSTFVSAPAHAWHRSALPGPCYQAARQGGPCGCVAESIIFGTTAHVLNGWNPWLARSWHIFASAFPAPGMAAIWGNRHVEAVVSSVHNGHFTTLGPYGHREVRIGSVRVVDPHGGHVASPGHRHYAPADRHYAHRYQQHHYFAWDRPRRFAYVADSWQAPTWWR